MCLKSDKYLITVTLKHFIQTFINNKYEMCIKDQVQIYCFMKV